VDIFTHEGLFALAQVTFINLVLSGDNAVVIGMAAAGLPARQRPQAIVAGIAAATILRILMAVIAVQLLEVRGLVLVGGLLLAWVCWRMWREIRAAESEHAPVGDAVVAAAEADSRPVKTLRQAAIQIVVADVSMSLDNVLAVAGAAQGHPTILAIGLALSIALMGLAASFIASLLNRYRWISYVGLLIIVYVAGQMIYRGALEIWPLAAGLT
jgi:YjbE family integral membrane protein